MATAELSDDVMRLRCYIDEAEQAGVTRLPPEPRLSDELGISRARLRTVLKSLETEGLIWRHIGKGTFIGPRPADPSSQAWSRSISLSDIMDARMMLEPQIAAQAAVHATAKDMDDCDRCIAEMAATPALLNWKRGDEKLHRLIAEATGNKLAVLMHDLLRDQLRMGFESQFERVLTGNSSQHDSDEQHQVIVDAIRRGDPGDAEQAMRDHLTKVRIKLFGSR